MKTKKVLMWCCGKKGQDFFELIENYPDYGYRIVGVTDRNTTNAFNKLYYSMDSIKECDYDIIVIANDNPKAIEEIKEYIIANHLADEKDIYWYFAFIAEVRRIKLIEKYKYTEDNEIRECIEYLQRNKLSVRNIWENKDKIRYELNMDAGVDMPYVSYYGKRMYFPRRYWLLYGDRGYIENVEEVDQYKHSPHLYTYGSHNVKEGDIILDAGACEGNFALKYIERIAKVYLVEPDEEWMEALSLSFRPWSNKVVFCNKYLGDVNGYSEITMDYLLRSESRLDFVKMDIEGNESEAILGGLETLRRLHPKVSVCSYHKENDERSLRFLLEALGYKTSISSGYMFYIWDKNIDSSMDFRRGVVYGE